MKKTIALAATVLSLAALPALACPAHQKDRNAQLPSAPSSQTVDGTGTVSTTQS